MLSIGGGGYGDLSHPATAETRGCNFMDIITTPGVYIEYNYMHKYRAKYKHKVL